MGSRGDIGPRLSDWTGGHHVTTNYPNNSALHVIERLGFVPRSFWVSFNLFIFFVCLFLSLDVLIRNDEHPGGRL